ncbi:pinensin family lanthipeptide [Roseivirga sp. BDSF3-8]|uniref:pinensin family lanthipeptide n=1 Tax=Roseivirga sp. BDSF3-8 TaxID=3241598 RepID=UPI003531E1A3
MKRKLSLDDLKVKSFNTSLSATKGGTILYPEPTGIRATDCQCVWSYIQPECQPTNNGCYNSIFRPC